MVLARNIHCVLNSDSCANDLVFCFSERRMVEKNKESKVSVVQKLENGNVEWKVLGSRFEVPD